MTPLRGGWWQEGSADSTQIRDLDSLKILTPCVVRLQQQEPSGGAEWITGGALESSGQNDWRCPSPMPPWSPLPR